MPEYAAFFYTTGEKCGLADIQIYLIRLADKLGIDLLGAVEKKISLNEKKYPVDKVRGSSRKYSEYPE